MTSYPVTITDGVALSDADSYQWGLLLTDTINTADTAQLAYQAGAIIAETIAMIDSLTGPGMYTASFTDALLLADAVARALKATLSETITLADVIRISRAVTVLDALVLADATVPVGRYHLALAELVVFNDSLARFFGRTLTDNIVFTESFAPQFQFNRKLADNVALLDVMSKSLYVRFVLSDTVQMSDLALMQAIFMGEVLTDNIEICVGLLEPSGSFTTWAINTRTSAVTEYQNYAFNSFARMGNHYLGASSAGLFRMDGEQDAGLPIPTSVRSGLMQLGGSHFTSFKAAYLGMRVRASGQPTFLLKLVAGDGTNYTYQFRPQNLMTTRVNFGKGLRARYFSWELITSGEDYDLDSIEFLPLIAQRRV